MSGTTSSERSTAAEQLQQAGHQSVQHANQHANQQHVHPNGQHVHQDYDASASTAAYTGGLTDEANQFHHAHHHSNSYASTAAQAAAELQHRAELQRRQQQLQQQELHQQHQLQQYHQQAAQAQQQQHQQQLQNHLQSHPNEVVGSNPASTTRYFEQQEYERREKLQRAQSFSYQLQADQRDFHDRENRKRELEQQRNQLQSDEHNLDDYETGGILTSKYNKDEVIENFTSKASLVAYVKDILSLEERCKIVINSSKPKAVYFQCERSGSFRTTVKDSTKRQRVAYTKRSKCGFRLVANLYPLEKDKKRPKREGDKDDEDDDPSAGPVTLGAEKWVLRMIEPIHNHPAEPLGSGAKKKRGKNSRTLVEKPIHRSAQGLTSHTSVANGNAAAAAASALAAANADAAARFVSNEMIDLGQTDPHLSQLHHQQRQQQQQQQSIALHRQSLGFGEPEAAVIAAIEGTPQSDGSIDPSVQAHDHTLRSLRR